jgi:L-lactate dehydrogenase
LSVSTLVESDFGIKDVCLSVPSVVSDRGVTRIIESPLTSKELASLSNSASILRKAIDSL